MKKKMLLLLLGAILSTNLLAGGIGMVNAQEVLARYPETKKTQKYLESKKLELQKILNKEKIRLENKRKELKEKGSLVTEIEKKELNEMEKEFKIKFRQIQQTLDQQQMTMFDKLKSDISLAVGEVAKIKGYDAVIDKAVLYYGGEDMTDDVIGFLTKVEKLDLD